MQSVEARFSVCEREGNAEQRSGGEAEKGGRGGSRKNSIFMAVEFQNIICVPCVHLWLVYLLRAPSFLRGFVFSPSVFSAGIGGIWGCGWRWGGWGMRKPPGGGRGLFDGISHEHS